MSKSRIEWTDRTWNVVTGCTPVSAGCERCYARIMARRFAGMNGYPEYPNHFGVTLRHDRLLDPFGWKKPQKVFTVSMGDLFHRDVPDRFVEHVFSVMERTPRHTYQVPTKQSDRMMEFCNCPSGKHLPAKNVWVGVSVEREDYTSRINHLRQTDAHVRFLSLEPLLGPLPDLDLEGIDWVIVGGESGPGARPMEVKWARAVRDQCVEARVPFFFKQWGRFLPSGQVGARKKDPFDAGVPRAWLEDRIYFSVGKQWSGCLLDGRQWKQFPEVSSEK